MIVDNVDVFVEYDVVEDGEEGEDGWEGGRVEDDEEGNVVDFEVVGEVVDFGVVFVGVGDDDDFVVFVYEFG